MGCKSGSTEINTQACVEEQTCIPTTASTCITAGSCTCSGSCRCGSSCSCGCTPCQCEQPRGTGSTPFFNQAPACQEDHKQFLIQQTFITAVATGKSFNMPACDASVTIYVPGVQQLQVGGYLWNVTYGYLQIVSFDFTTGTAVVKNNCEDGNASPGTEIPSCTMFNVVDPPYDNTRACDGLAVYITADFVIPAISATVTIAVTGIEGLTLNGIVQIGTGYYTITAIGSSTAITIQNDGGGGTPGLTVSAQDVNGNCISPVVPYADTPCERSAVDSGALVVCKSGVTSPLDADSLNQIPVVIDVATNEVEFQSIAIPTEVCSFLTSCLNIINGTDSYTLIVDDTSVFTVGELVVIHTPSIDGVLWVVDTITDATHMDITSVAANTTTDTIPVDTLVCVAHCCDQLNYKVDNNYFDHVDARQVNSNNSGDGKEAGTVTEGNTYTTANRTAEITNDSTSVMRVLVNVRYSIIGNINTNQGAWFRHEFRPRLAHSIIALPGPAPVPGKVTLLTLEKEEVHGRGAGGACNVYLAKHYETYHYAFTVSVPASSVIRVDANFEWYFKNYHSGQEACCDCGDLVGNPTGVFSVSEADVAIELFGVAV